MTPITYSEGLVCAAETDPERVMQACIELRAAAKHPLEIGILVVPFLVLPEIHQEAAYMNVVIKSVIDGGNYIEAEIDDTVELFARRLVDDKKYFADYVKSMQP